MKELFFFIAVMLLLLRQLQTSETYFDGIVEVLVETLSCVEAEDLDLKHREETETEKQAEDRLQISTFNCCLCNYQRPAGGRRTLIGSALLHWVTN